MTIQDSQASASLWKTTAVRLGERVRRGPDRDFGLVCDAYERATSTDLTGLPQRHGDTEAFSVSPCLCGQHSTNFHEKRSPDGSGEKIRLPLLIARLPNYALDTTRRHALHNAATIRGCIGRRDDEVFEPNAGLKTFSFLDTEVLPFRQRRPAGARFLLRPLDVFFCLEGLCGYRWRKQRE